MPSLLLQEGQCCLLPGSKLLPASVIGSCPFLPLNILCCHLAKLHLKVETQIQFHIPISPEVWVLGIPSTPPHFLILAGLVPSLRVDSNCIIMTGKFFCKMKIPFIPFLFSCARNPGLFLNFGKPFQVISWDCQVWQQMPCLAYTSQVCK